MSTCTETTRTMRFYCMEQHRSRQGGPQLLGHIAEGVQGVLVCPDWRCGRRYLCKVGNADEHGDLPTQQTSLKRCIDKQSHGV